MTKVHVNIWSMILFTRVAKPGTNIRGTIVRRNLDNINTAWVLWDDIKIRPDDVVPLFGDIELELCEII